MRYSGRFMLASLLSEAARCGLAAFILAKN